MVGHSQQKRITAQSQACLLGVHTCWDWTHNFVAAEGADLKGQVGGCSEQRTVAAAYTALALQGDGALEVETAEKDLQVGVAALAESTVVPEAMADIVLLVAAAAELAFDIADVWYLLSDLAGGSKVLVVRTGQMGPGTEVIEQETEQEMGFVVAGVVVVVEQLGVEAIVGQVAVMPAAAKNLVVQCFQVL